jgi:tripartite-type tricarboxylate transporter receptor subunit TctC
MTHIVYRGAGPALADVLGGQVDLMFASIVSAFPHAKSGKLRALAVTSTRRSAVVPEFPTVAEAGVPGFEMIGYFGLLAPARTPAAIVTTVHSAVQRTLRRRDIVERLAADGAEPDGCTPAARAARARHAKAFRAGAGRENPAPVSQRDFFSAGLTLSMSAWTCAQLRS